MAEAPDLDVTEHDPCHEEFSLREVLVHMVEEYARHNGHADLLRDPCRRGERYPLKRLTVREELRARLTEVQDHAPSA